jgi:hypothetical protein
MCESPTPANFPDVIKNCDPGFPDRQWMAAATTPRMARNSASEMPIHQPKNSRSASAAQAATPPVAASADWRVWNRVWIRLRSTSLFLWDDEGEVSAFGIGAGFRLGGCARGAGEHGGRAGFASSHQPSLRSRRGNRTRRMGREMIFAMRRACRGRSQRLCAERSEVSVFLCRFSAGCFARRGAERPQSAFLGPIRRC